MEDKKKLVLYWSIQIIAWGGLTLFLLFMLVNYSSEPIHIKAKLLQLVIGLACFITSHLYRQVIKIYHWVEYSLKKLFPMIILGAFLSALFSQILIHIGMLTILQWETYRPIVWSEFPFYVLNLFVPFLGWSIFYFGYHYFEKARKSRIDSLRAESAVKEAELIALKSQINPHFLFNSLNNIKALILEDPMKARDAISNLSDLLRYSVKFSNQTQVLLKAEIEIVKNYLELESFQYDNRLEFHLEIDELTLDKMIPPMIIQLMVENAVKHGISQLPGGGEIRISTSLEEDKLMISVENNGSIQETSTEGTGIRNALDRIRILYDVEPSFTLNELEGVVCATLKLPALS